MSAPALHLFDPATTTIMLAAPVSLSTVLAGAAVIFLFALALYPSSLLRWFQRKRYQYEVTFSLYMLTPTEKFIFSECSIRLVLYTTIVPFANHFAISRLHPLPLPVHGLDRRRIVPAPSCQHHSSPCLLLPLWRLAQERNCE
jgi:hypothetical protein